MKGIIISTLLLFTFSVTKAQRVHATLFGGITNYQGDLQSKRFTFQQANGAFGIGALYEFTDKLYLRANATFGRVSGNDKIAGNYLTRNLNFTSAINDYHLGHEYDIMNSYQNSLVPFVFAGVSYFHFNPSTVDSLGKKVYLQALGTEGQGFYLGREKYKLNSFALPFGGGVKLSLSENIRVRFEFGLRKTGTDYLDDVSTTYADQAELLANNGQQAVDLAFRGDEDKSGLSYPAANTIRGNPKSKDWYYFTGVGVSIRLAPRVDINGGKGRSNCPVNVY